MLHLVVLLLLGLELLMPCKIVLQEYKLPLQSPAMLDEIFCLCCLPSFIFLLTLSAMHFLDVLVIKLLTNIIAYLHNICKFNNFSLIKTYYFIINIIFQRYFFSFLFYLFFNHLLLYIIYHIKEGFYIFRYVFKSISFMII